MERLTNIQQSLLYLGPGMGGGVLSAILGILTAFILSIFAILWYPLKKLIRFLKSKFVNSR